MFQKCRNSQVLNRRVHLLRDLVVIVLRTAGVARRRSNYIDRTRNVSVFRRWTISALHNRVEVCCRNVFTGNCAKQPTGDFIQFIPKRQFLV